MWARTIVLLLFVQACTPQYLEDEAEEYKNADFYDNSEETEPTMPLLTTAPMESYTRVRRFEKADERRTLGPQELRAVRGALRDIFANRRIEAGVAAEFTKTSPSSLLESTDKSANRTDQSYDQSESPVTVNNGSDSSLDDTQIKGIKDILQLPTEDPIVTSSTYTPQQYEWKSTTEQRSTNQEELVHGKKEQRSVLREAVRGLSSRVETWQPMDPTNTILTTLLEYLDNSTDRTLSHEEIMEVEGALQRFISKQKHNTNSPISSKNMSTIMTYAPFRTNYSDTEDSIVSTSTEWGDVTTDEGDDETEEYEEDEDDDPLRERKEKKGGVWKKRKRRKKTKPTKPWWKTKKTKEPVPEGMVLDGTFHTFPRGWPYKQTKCPTTVSTPFQMNLHGMLWLLSNLTYEYDMHLVERFNESLYRYSVPSCRPRPGQMLGVGTTPFDVDNATVVAKCFVCGLKATHIPKDAYCADAFAGDFLPLVPVDPRARGHIARYRKYCRFADLRDAVEYPDRPRAVYGRFSPGCSVRWTDLSGVYTQRSCRNRRRAVTGNHFGSKRMAKLEMALNHLENGCIISPMATLLPLSRGISLYARFHACVCTGAWCNRAVRDAPWMVYIILSFWLYNVLQSF